MAEIETGYVPSGGARLFLRESGAGPALVCLHAGVADHRMFDAQHAGLSDRVRTISYDRRGFGHTRTPDEPFSHVGDLARVFADRALDSAILLGCSQGGRIAIDFALAFPEKVAGLFLVAPVVSGMPAPELPPDQRALDAEIDRAYEVEDLARINALEIRVWLDGPASKAGRVAGPARDLFSEMNARVLEHPELTGECPPGSAWDRVQGIAVPVMLCCGDLDYAFMRGICGRLKNRIPGAEYLTLPGMAHMPFLEDPALMNATIRRFLERLTGP